MSARPTIARARHRSHGRFARRPMQDLTLEQRLAATEEELRRVKLAYGLLEQALALADRRSEDR